MAENTDSNGVDLGDVSVNAGGSGSAGSPEPEGRKRIVWADSKDEKLTQTMVSTRLHYSVNYNSASFSSSPMASDDDVAAAENTGGAGEPPNQKIENCCVVS